MSTKEKIIEVPDSVIEHIRTDLNGDGVHIYAIHEVPKVFIQRDLINPEVLKKSTCVVAAVSGCSPDQRDYAFLAAARIDKVSGCYVTDLDPISMAFSWSTLTPEASGVVRFHGDFHGRTEFETANLSLSELQAQITGTKLGFEEAPERFKAAMHFMADCYKTRFDSTE